MCTLEHEVTNLMNKCQNWEWLCYFSFFRRCRNETNCDKLHKCSHPMGNGRICWDQTHTKVMHMKGLTGNANVETAQE